MVALSGGLLLELSVLLRQKLATSRGYAHHRAAVHPRVLDEAAVIRIFPYRQARA